MEARTVNILQLGFGFTLVFAAFFSASFIEEIVIDSIARDNNTIELDPKAGFYSLSIIYAVFTPFNLVAPSVISVIGAKWSMVIGAICYALFMISFQLLSTWMLFGASALLGVGAALIWTGQGNYLTLSSDSQTIGRNSGVLWAMLQTALLIGGVFLYFEIGSKERIDYGTARLIYGCFAVVSVLGVACLALLRSPTPSRPSLMSEFSAPSASTGYRLLSSSDRSEGSALGREVVSDAASIDGDLVESISAQNPAVVDGVTVAPRPLAGSLASSDLSPFVQELVKTFKLLMTWQMISLSVVFLYGGIETTFWTGVYSTCLGFTGHFHKAKYTLVALNAIFIGFGEILGGGAFGLFGHRTNIYGRNPIILLGTLVHLAAFFLVFLNIPATATLHQTNDSAYIEPNEYLALFCSFLLGLADACWNTQIYSLLGFLYPENSAPAFSLFKFFQSLAACGSFYYGSQLLLHWQLLILVVGDVLAALCFFPVEVHAQIRGAGYKAF